MRIIDLKKLLDRFDENLEIIVLNEDRLGHDDAILEFDLVKGFANSKRDFEDVRLEETLEDRNNYDEDDETSWKFVHPCCVISVCAGS